MIHKFVFFLVYIFHTHTVKTVTIYHSVLTFSLQSYLDFFFYICFVIKLRVESAVERHEIKITPIVYFFFIFDKKKKTGDKYNFLLH